MLRLLLLSVTIMTAVVDCQTTHKRRPRLMKRSHGVYNVEVTPEDKRVSTREVRNNHVCYAERPNS